MLAFPEESEYFSIEWSLPWVLTFSKNNGKDGEILNGWKINSKSLGDYFITSNDFWNFLFFMLKQDSDIVFCW